MATKDALGMTLEISQDFIDNLAKNLVTESLIETLNSKDDIVKQIVSSILSVKVNDDGKISSYSSDNKYTYLQYLVNNMIKEEVLNVANEVLNEKKEQIRESIKHEFSKKATLDKFYNAFFSSIVDNLSNAYRTTVEVKVDRYENY